MSIATQQMPPTNSHSQEFRVGIACNARTDYTLYRPVLDAAIASGYVSFVGQINLQKHAERSMRTGIVRELLDRVEQHKQSAKIDAQRLAVERLLTPLSTIIYDETAEISALTRKQFSDLDLDIILQCGQPLCNELAQFAKYGIWSFDFLPKDGPEPPNVDAESPPKKELVARIGLLCHVAHKDELLLLGRTVVKKHQGISSLADAETNGQAAAELLRWKLWQLSNARQDGRGIDVLASKTFITQPSIDAIESSFKLTIEVLRKLGGVFSSKEAGSAREWQIGLRSSRENEPWNNDWKDFQWIEAPSGHYFADPFLLHHGDDYWLFAEDYVSASEKGVLSCAPIRSDGGIGQWNVVLDLPYHLSFPLIFDHEGEVYMIPESQADGCVELYRASAFPYAWTKVRTLWHGAGADTVPYQGDDGIWYFFTTVQHHLLTPPQLLLFTAPSLQSDWQLHPANPLSLDVRYARNGGRILKMPEEGRGSRLIRVSQDGSGNYGSKLHFHQIENINPLQYKERLIGSRLPPKGRDGNHHYERCGEWEVTDIS